MKKKKVANTLSDMLNRIVEDAYDKKSPLASKGQIVLGDLIVKREDRRYNIIDRRTKDIVYADIFLVDAALLMAKFHQLNSYTSLRRVKELEHTYGKHRMDMKYSTRLHASARKSGDYDQMAIAETKYECAKLYAKQAKEDIRRIRNRM